MMLEIGDRITTKTNDRGTIERPPSWGGAMVDLYAFVLLDNAPSPNPRWISWEAIAPEPKRSTKATKKRSKRSTKAKEACV